VSKLMLLMSFIGVSFAASAAHAGAGDYRESARYGRIAPISTFICPEGTTRQVVNKPDGAEESCVTPDGVRHGYYLRWQVGGEDWAELGTYENGQAVGRWIEFTPDGRPALVRYKKVKKALALR